MAITFGKYVLKKPVMTDNRLQKIIKGILGEYQDDRNKALDGYRMFLDKIELNTANIAGLDLVKGMIDCLKLAQSASSNQLKIIDICVKLNVLMRDRENKGLGDLNKKGSSSLFDQLDSVINEQRKGDGSDD